MSSDLTWLFDITEDDLPTVAEIVPELVLVRLRAAIEARVRDRTPVGIAFFVISSGRSFGLPMVEKK